MNARKFLATVVFILSTLAPAGQAASEPPQSLDPILSLNPPEQSTQAVPEVGTPGSPPAPDSIKGRVPIVLRASHGVAPFRIAPRLSPAPYRTQSATFIVNYVPAGTQNALGDDCLNWPAGSKAAFQYATNLWGVLLNSSVPIKIDACWASLGEGVLGHSATDSYYRNFTGAPQANTWYSVALADALSGTDLNGSDPEMHIAYSSSSSFTWYFGTDGNPPMNQYDFVSVVTHEIAHGLNFAGSMRVSSGQGSWGFPGYSTVPVIYDRFTQNGSGQALINTSLFPNPSTQLAAQLTSNNVYFNGTYANAANGGQRPKLYAPSTWRPGSSYAHLDLIFDGTPNALMTYSLDDGEAIHDPGPVTCGIFRDLGWQNPCQTTAAPTVTSIAPNNGTNSGTVHITNLAGSNFQAGATVELTRSGQADISATNVVVVGASQITCDFDLTGAAAGQWNVVVTNPDSQSGTLPNGFTVNTPAAAPTVTGITPNSGSYTGTVHITNLAGSNFQPGATVKLTRSGQTDINATNVVVVGASQITCDFNLTGAATGQWNVVVTNPGSQSGTLPNGFTVNAGTNISLYLPIVMNRWPPIPDTPTLNAISNPSGSVNYTVSWNAAYLANTYTLQEANDAAFSSPVVVYGPGSGLSWSASGKAAGTYYYRVKASNSYGDSGWSNVQSVVVQSPSIFYAIADASALQGIPDTNDGTDPTMWTGYEHCSSFSGIARSLVKFDLSAIPAGTQIAQATLSLYLAGSCDTGNNSRPVTTYRITNDWSETSVTWNAQPGLAEAYGSSSVSSRTFQRYPVDVTNLVRAWVNHTYSNYGLMLRSPEASDSARLAFYTRQAGSAYAPYITITYAGAVTSMNDTTTIEGIPDLQCKLAIKGTPNVSSNPLKSGMFEVVEGSQCSRR